MIPTDHYAFLPNSSDFYLVREESNLLEQKTSLKVTRINLSDLFSIIFNSSDQKNPSTKLVQTKKTKLQDWEKYLCLFFSLFYFSRIYNFLREENYVNIKFHETFNFICHLKIRYFHFRTKCSVLWNNYHQIQLQVGGSFCHNSSRFQFIKK